MTTRVVVLEAGLRGLELTTQMADELGDQVHDTLLDKSQRFELIGKSACR